MSESTRVYIFISLEVIGELLVTSWWQEKVAQIGTGRAVTYGMPGPMMEMLSPTGYHGILAHSPEHKNTEINISTHWRNVPDLRPAPWKELHVWYHNPKSYGWGRLPS